MWPQQRTKHIIVIFIVKKETLATSHKNLHPSVQNPCSIAEDQKRYLTDEQRIVLMVKNLLVQFNLSLFMKSKSVPGTSSVLPSSKLFLPTRTRRRMGPRMEGGQKRDKERKKRKTGCQGKIRLYPLSKNYLTVYIVSGPTVWRCFKWVSCFSDRTHS